MSAFDPIKKHKNKKDMPVTNLDTSELLDQISAGMLSQPQSEALTELYARVIKENDSDDHVVSSTPAWRGGIRPKHAPLV